jgi:Rps23 Pro-64 3,4-dihydroxylase Tpa1-like proline 4-hydroxylase
MLKNAQVSSSQLLNGLEADMNRLNAIAESRKNEYSNASPFPHIMIEDFMDANLLHEVCSEFPEQNRSDWNQMIDKDQKKFSANKTELLGPATRKVLHFLNSREIINFLESLTGISGLIPDPHLAGGGLHELREGGFLKIHADFNWHKQLRLDRRINLLVYLNEDWKPEYEGCLELWDTSMKAKVAEYLPTFNRCVIFNTTNNSYHGNPVPVACPAGRSRRSIAMYYYTNGRPTEEVAESHGTLFRNRPGEATAGEKRRDLITQLTPPILLDLYRGLKK